MKYRLYLETTVPSYLTAELSGDLIIAGHQRLTVEWWKFRKKDFDIYISQFVIDEASAGDKVAARKRLEVIKDFPILTITDDVVKLAKMLIVSGVIPKKAAIDAAHIAISAIHRMDFLMTWNYTHLANAMISSAVRKVCEQEGYQCPTICTPEELLEG